jgi:hypothetical protein
MRSRCIISKKFFVLVGYFLGISLLVRVKIPILRVSLKKYTIRKVFFSKIGVLYSRTKAKGGVKIGRCKSKGTIARDTGPGNATTR